MVFGENYMREIIKKAIITLLVAIGISFLVFNEPMSYVRGFIFGGSINILCFKLIEMDAKKAVKAQQDTFARGVTTRGYMGRYVIYAVVMAVAAKADYINMWTTAASLFTITTIIKASAIIDAVKMPATGSRERNR